jgi:hypothetical protein
MSGVPCISATDSLAGAAGNQRRYRSAAPKHARGPGKRDPPFATARSLGSCRAGRRSQPMMFRPVEVCVAIHTQPPRELGSQLLLCLQPDFGWTAQFGAHRQQHIPSRLSLGCLPSKPQNNSRGLVAHASGSTLPADGTSFNRSLISSSSSWLLINQLQT